MKNCQTHSAFTAVNNCWRIKYGNKEENYSDPFEICKICQNHFNTKANFLSQLASYCFWKAWREFEYGSQSVECDVAHSFEYVSSRES